MSMEAAAEWLWVGTGFVWLLVLAAGIRNELIVGLAVLGFAVLAGISAFTEPWDWLTTPH